MNGVGCRRFGVLLDLCVLIAALCWYWREYRDLIPADLFFPIRLVVVFTVVVGVAPVINYVASLPVPPGTKFLAVAVAVVDGLMAAHIAHLIRR